MRSLGFLEHQALDRYPWRIVCLDLWDSFGSFSVWFEYSMDGMLNRYLRRMELSIHFRLLFDSLQCLMDSWWISDGFSLISNKISSGFLENEASNRYLRIVIGLFAGLLAGLFRESFSFEGKSNEALASFSGFFEDSFDFFQSERQMMFSGFGSGWNGFDPFWRLAGCLRILEDSFHETEQFQDRKGTELDKFFKKEGMWILVEI